MEKNDWQGRLKNGYMFDEVASALQKSIRRGLEFEALFWAKVLCSAGYDLYVWRRLGMIKRI